MAERDRSRGERPPDSRSRGEGARGGPRRDGPRGGGPGSGSPAGPRPRGAGPQGGRHWDTGPRGDRPRGDRPPGDRVQGGRPSADRPQFDRPQFDRPQFDRPQFDRPRENRPWEDRPTERRPADRGPSADRPRSDGGAAPRPRSGPPDTRRPQDRPWQDRPLRDDGPPFKRRGPYDRPPSGRPPRDNRPFQQGRGDADRAQRPYGPWQARPTPDNRPWPDRPRRQFGGRPGSDRPPRAPVVERDNLVAEEDELIAGRRPVEEAFAARREATRLLIVPERRAALDALAIHATTLRIPVVEVEGGTLTALAGFDGHQGVALVAKPRPAGDVQSILARARERREAPFVLVLDSLEDPQNFGTLLRSAEAVGAHGVIYPTRRAAPLSPAAIKASAGATEHLVLAAVEDLAGTLADLHGEGLRVVGADETASLAYGDADMRGPLAVVVGSEGRGISGPVRRRLDVSVSIPMRGRIGSLNAAVAGSILLFAAAQQRPMPASGQPPAPPPEPPPEQTPVEAPDEPVETANAADEPDRGAGETASEPDDEPQSPPQIEPPTTEEGLLPGDR